MKSVLLAGGSFISLLKAMRILVMVHLGFLCFPKKSIIPILIIRITVESRLSVGNYPSKNSTVGCAANGGCRALIDSGSSVIIGPLPIVRRIYKAAGVSLDKSLAGKLSYQQSEFKQIYMVNIFVVNRKSCCCALPKA